MKKSILFLLIFLTIALFSFLIMIIYTDKKDDHNVLNLNSFSTNNISSDLSEIMNNAETNDFNQIDSEQSILNRINNKSTCNQLIKQSYPISSFFSNSGFGFGSYFSAKSHSGYYETLQSVNEKCKIECIRDMGDGNYYTVFHPEEGGRIFSFFPKEENQLLSHNIYVLKPLNKEKFKQLKSGDTFSKVLKLDPAMKRCYEKDMLCNIISIQKETYSIHLFKDTLMLISWKTNDNSEDTPENVVVNTIQEFSDKKLIINIENSMANGVYDYSILSQDYPE